MNSETKPAESRYFPFGRDAVWDGAGDLVAAKSEEIFSNLSTRKLRPCLGFIVILHPHSIAHPFSFDTYVCVCVSDRGEAQSYFFFCVL